MKAVDRLGVPEVGPAEALGQRLLAGRDGDQVDVVAHQAVGEDVQAVDSAFLDEQAEVELAVVIDEEDILAVVAPLHDVMRTARYDDACDSRHGGMLPPGRAGVKSDGENM